MEESTERSQVRLVVDLDNTICIPNMEGKTTKERYGTEKCIPCKKMIVALRKAKFEYNHYIIIHTARRMLTHDHNVHKVIEDVAPLTILWLRYYHVPYDEIVFGKPFGHFYIDDKACLPETFAVDIMGEES